MNKAKPSSQHTRMRPREKSKSFKFQAKTNIKVRIGGRMMHWQQGEGIDLNEETLRQYLHPSDYEKISQATDRKPQSGKN
jgi:hypothetical protein